jgi:putative redox protein
MSTYLEKHYKAASLLVGHSLGGAAVIVAASKLENVKAVATIGAPATVNHVTHLFSHTLDAIPEKGEIEVQIGGRPFKINQDFVADFSKTALPEIIKELRKRISQT